jgi:hypothetical protein
VLWAHEWSSLKGMRSLAGTDRRATNCVVIHSEPREQVVERQLKPGNHLDAGAAGGPEVPLPTKASNAMVRPMAALIFVLFLALFVGLVVWSIRASRAQKMAREEKLAQMGFAKQINPQRIAQIKQTFSKKVIGNQIYANMEDSMFERVNDGYSLWMLEKSDSEGPGQPFLAVVLNDAMGSGQYDKESWRAASPTHTCLQGVWIIPAFGDNGSMTQKALGFVARMAGYAHLLPLNGALDKHWWAYANHPTWQPYSPGQDFLDALNDAPSLSVCGTPSGLIVEAQPDGAGNRAVNTDGSSNGHKFRMPSRDSLLDPKMIETTKRFAQSVLRG